MFVNLAIDCGYYGANHGIAFLVPIVKKYSYEVSCLDIDRNISIGKFIAKIKKLNPSIIAFSATSQQLIYLEKYSKALSKQFPNLLQIAGGVGPTLDPELFLSKSHVKGVCVGEGEQHLTNLLDNLKNSENLLSTQGFYWKDEEKIIKNEVPKYISDISSLDFPDYSVFKKSKVNSMVERKRQLRVMISRGCPYNCTYCCNHALKKIYPDDRGYFRLPNVEYAIKLLENLLEKYNDVKYIFFEDDLLIMDKKWFKHFIEEYYQRINIPYKINVRCEGIDKELVELLKKTGCDIVFLGIESGNDEFRKKILNRHHTNKQILEKCELLKEGGLQLYTFNIVGFPFETKKEMNDTLNLNKKIEPDSGQCSFYYPYKGTELYKLCEENDLLRDEKQLMKLTNYNMRPSLKLTKEQEKEIISYYQKIYLYLNRRGGFATKVKVVLIKYPIFNNLQRGYNKVKYLWSFMKYEKNPE